MASNKHSARSRAQVVANGAPRVRTPATPGLRTGGERLATVNPIIGLRSGSRAFRCLMKDLAEVRWLDEVGDDEDGREYIEFVRIIDRSIRANLTDASGPHREGYLRTLADFLGMVIDGGLPTESNWDPIENTAAAYARVVKAAGASAEGGRHE